MDRQQADRVRAFFLGHRLELRCADCLLVADELDEALDVGAAQLLIRACEPHQLAQVRVPALAVPLREHGQVVVVRGDDLLAEALERLARGRRCKALVTLLEGTHEPLVGVRERIGQRALDAAIERALPRMPADEHERVVRQPDERRREHRNERFVVVAVVQQPQVAQQVDDLLLAEVPAARRAIGREAGATQRRFVAFRIGAGREQQDDLAG